MKVLEKDGFFKDTMIDEINDAIMRANVLIAPAANTGEIIIYYCLKGNTEFKCAYHATLDDGAGKSYATRKINTLITHYMSNCTGHLTHFELRGCEVNQYGSNRLRGHAYSDQPSGLNVLPGCGGAVEFLVAFSGRGEWQDEIFVAAVRHVLLMNNAIFIKDDLDDDPVVGTARLIVQNACY